MLFKLKTLRVVKCLREVFFTKILKTATLNRKMREYRAVRIRVLTMFKGV